MRIRLPAPVYALLFFASCVCLLSPGCASADIDAYQRRISELNEAAAGSREDISHLPAAAELETEMERVEAAGAALEEASAALREILLELEEVKVPAGWEDFHRALLGSYRGELALYEGIMAALEPAGEHAADEGHAGEESAETPKEGPEQAHPEEAEDTHGEPAGGGGH